MNMLNLPKKVYFKNGSMNVALRELREVYHFQRAFLVSDPHLYRAGLVSPVDCWLRKQGLRTAEFFTIGCPPSFADVRSALPKLAEFEPDVILGLGGTSAMSAAKALRLAHDHPETDIAILAAHPEKISSAGTTALVLVAYTFACGAQNSPFAVLADDHERLCAIRSDFLLPEMSVTDSRFVQTLSPAQIHAGGLRLLALAIRAYAAQEGEGTYTQGPLTEAVRLTLRYLFWAEQGCPEALEHLHNAGALLGTACGHLTHLPPPDSPLWLSPEERGDGEARLLPLARDLGFPDIGAMQAVFHGLE